MFDDPKTLPPHRGLDHHIPLKIGSDPFSIGPYRYPQVKKTKIENIVKKMLESGIVQPGQSSFAYPVLLVKKKDGSCEDYKAQSYHYKGKNFLFQSLRSYWMN